VEGSPALAAKGVSVFPQGSYRNRTNVRADSDVDVCVRYSGSLFYDLPAGVSPEQVHLTVPASYSFDQFRADVSAAMLTYFGAGAMRIGTKAFEIHENTYRIAADVVPCFEYRNYYRLGAGPLVGTGFVAAGSRIVNYPDQHYASGVAKNDRTNKRFKAVVRVLKHLRYEMLAAGMESAKHAPSYAIESLVWNVPDPYLGVASLRSDIVSVIAWLWGGMKDDDSCGAWLETNAVKPFFTSAQAWQREPLRTYLFDAWVYAHLGEK
jgi:hypothetical protein